MAEAQFKQGVAVNAPSDTTFTTVYAKTDGLMYSNSITSGEKVMTSIGISIEIALNLAAFRA